MPSGWLFRPLPLRERVGRGVAPVSRTLRTRQLVMPSPPHPNPLPRGEREPEVPSDKGVIASSTVLPLSGRADRSSTEPESAFRTLGASAREALDRVGPTMNQWVGPP